MFEQHEEVIRALIKKAHAPVLGLLGGLMPPGARSALAEDVLVNPSAKAFSQRLDKYPALFAVWLAEHVMLGIGSTGRFDVYPHVQKALGGPGELNESDRELLWRAFRRAMFRLGIQPLPRTFGPRYMTDEYARQAGVPIAFADDLASRMLRLVKRLGLPDEDDQESLLTWQAALLHRLQPPFSVTARKAVERDVQAYYTRAFLRVQSNQGRPSPGDALEAALASAFVREGGVGHIKRAAMPQLLYRDGVLGVRFPGATSPSTYELQSDDNSLSVGTDKHDVFQPLPGDLPSDVRVTGPEGERVLNVKLWPDRAANRLLIFNDSGSLRASAQLGQAQVIELPPGRYVALCRFAPTNVEGWEVVNEAPQLVEVLLDVRPGADCALINGTATVSIVGENVPSFRLEGNIKAGLERVEFYYGNLNAEVEIPPDWQQSGQQSYEIRVSCGASSCAVPLHLDQGGTASVELHDELQGLKVQPGLQRLVIELARIGDARTLQRQSALYWRGLLSISYGLRFEYETPPQNLVSSACNGLMFNEKWAEPTSECGRVIRTGFDVGGGRLTHLSWNRPGLFVEVETMGRDGNVSVLRPLGSTETVSLTDDKNIVVSASEPGFISLGEWRCFVDFGHHPTKAFSATFLATRLEPGARTLYYETQTGSAKTPLLDLSRPHVATSVATSRLVNILEVRLIVQGEPTNIAVTGKDLGTGREIRVEHVLVAGTWHRDGFARMQVYSVPAVTGHMVCVLIDTLTVPVGVWSIGFELRIGGAWGRLEDSDEGRIGVAFAVSQTGREISSSTVVSGVAGLDIHEAARRLTFLNGHFRQLWSPSCWEQQSWLLNYWSSLVDRIRGEEAQCLTEIADMAMARADSSVREGFIPRQSIGGQLPLFFALEKAEYRRVNPKPHPLSIALRAMPELRGTIVPAFGPTLHPGTAFAFKNGAEIIKGKRPKEFSVNLYVQTLGQMLPDSPHRLDDELFIPATGELLAPIHLAHAWRDLDKGYAASNLMPSHRKSLALALGRALYQRSSRFDDLAPPGLRGQAPVIQLTRIRIAGVDEAEQQRQENVERIANACAWFAWHCRLEVRRPGTLAKFLDSLRALRIKIEVPSAEVSDCLAYYLHVAPAMFAYYLLLWELVLTVELDPVVHHV